MNAADEARAVEAEMAMSVDTIVCVSADEASALRALGAREPFVVEPWLSDLALTPAGFAARSDVFLVAGWLAGPESPNVDGLLWFVHEVLPIVRARVPWVRVRVSGPAPPKVALDAGGRGIFFEGQVSNMAEFYGRTRACIVPLRYGAGVKIKTVEALQYGVPTVATKCRRRGHRLARHRCVVGRRRCPGLRRGARFAADRSRGLGPATGRDREARRAASIRGVQGHLGLYPGGSRGRPNGHLPAT